MVVLNTMFKSQNIFFIFAYIRLSLSEDKILPAGFYTLKLINFEKCSDVGKNEIDFDLHLSRKSAKVLNFVGNITLKRSSDDNYKVEFILDKWGNGGWRLNSYIQKEDNACEAIDTFMGKPFKDLMSNCILGECLKKNPKQKKTCPLLAGTYENKGYDVGQIKTLNIPAGIAGRWRITFKIMDRKDDQIVGCFKVSVDCLPKGIV